MASIVNEALLRTIGRWGITLLLILILFILSALPLEVFALGEIRPFFMLMAVYYLAIIRPSFISPLVAFVIGLMLDFISAYPLGLSAFILVTVQWLVCSQQKLLQAQPFKVIWVGFVIVALASALVQWSVFAIFNLALFPFKSIFISTLLSSFIFPLLVLPLAMVNKALSDSD